MAASAQVIPFPQQAEPQGQEPAFKGRDLTSLRKQFQNAVSSKQAENQEAADAERYFHGAQWSDSELKTLADRNQPAVVFNRIKRKINTVVGILEKMKQDPKAYPRTPNQQAQDGAELSTNVLKYALGWDWNDRASTVARRCAVRGISGVELVVTGGDQGDPEVELDDVDHRDYFYDPRSTKADFTDVRFEGTSRWVDLDEAQVTFPDHEEALANFVERGWAADWERGDERQKISWVNKEEKQVRIVDHWYKRGNDWFYSIYCGETILEEGPSPFRDHKKRSMSKFIMLANDVDQDNDRYGFFRDLKGPQDEVNHRRSKALHALNTRQVLAEKGAVDDVDKARKELARNDGWVEINPGSGDMQKRFEIRDQQSAQTVQQNLEMLQEAKSEIDNYGPNPGLIGTEVDASSGRAIQLLQAAGIAELGTFMVSYRNWKLRVYRSVWCAVQQFWTAPRWVRVTDDDNMAQFIQVNGFEKDEYGFPVVINQLAALDVDIIIEEGPDTVNTMADTFDTLLALAKNGSAVPPEVIIELSALPSSVKKRVMQQMTQGQQDPRQDQAVQLKMEQEQAKLQLTQSEVALNSAKVQQVLAETANPETGEQVDTTADLAKARLDVAKAMEIEQKVAAPPQDTPEPGLWEVNQAKAAKDMASAAKEAAAADRERVRTRNLLQTGAEEPAKIPPPKPPGGDR